MEAPRVTTGIVASSLFLHALLGLSFIIGFTGMGVEERSCRQGIEHSGRFESVAEQARGNGELGDAKRV